MKRQKQYRPRRAARFQTTEEQAASPSRQILTIEGAVEPSSMRRPVCVKANGYRGFPRTLAELNAIFAAYGASFSHAWNLDEDSGNATDLATSGQIPLVPQAGALQGVKTGLLPLNDKGVQFVDNSALYIAPSAAASLNVPSNGDGDVIILMTIQITATPGGDDRTIFVKEASDGSVHYKLQYLSNRRFVFSCKGAEGASTATNGGPHATGDFFDVVVFLDRTTSNTAGVATSAFVVQTADVSAVGTIGAIDTVFKIGGHPTAPFICSFFAWGSTVGTLPSNTAAALAAFRDFRGA